MNDLDKFEAAALLQQPNVAPTIADTLRHADAALRELAYRMNIGQAGASEMHVRAWSAELYLWQQDIAQLSEVLTRAGFKVPSPQSPPLQALNEWANLLPSLQAHFAAPVNAVPMVH